MPAISARNRAKECVVRTQLIGNETEIGQDPELADGRDNDFAIRILGRKAWIDWHHITFENPQVLGGKLGTTNLHC